jgi:uncharacterized protein (TIGR00375 family)
MPFVADLHIHSHFSRATSRELDLEHLHATAQRKGVRVVGSGDLTHPGWQRELRERLVPAEPGLFRLRPELAQPLDRDVPAACHGPVSFLLTGEISSIYKRVGADGESRVRKVHNVVLAPSFEVMARLSEALGRIGNLTSDGRPILGLDSRDLLETVLEAGGLLIPAHIWTPWFSALGGRSGFDSIDECYADLTPHVFAVETGLSSDPPMNWRVSGLDRFALVSNSDAHSPDKLGREANLFAGEPSYDGIIDALRTRGHLGTIEFYPEEGKYHLDGHRACGVRLEPTETALHGGRCPACGKPVTVGVLHRVEQLADHAGPRRPEGAAGFESLVPLVEVLAEVHGVGPGARQVGRTLAPLLQRLGPELYVLREAPPEEVARVASPLVAEAVRRARTGEVHVEPGYDGEYGRVRLFAPDERRELGSQGGLFAVPAPAAPNEHGHGPRPTAHGPRPTAHGPRPTADGPRPTALGPRPAATATATDTAHGPRPRPTAHGPRPAATDTDTAHGRRPRPTATATPHEHGHGPRPADAPTAHEREHEREHEQIGAAAQTDEHAGQLSLFGAAALDPAAALLAGLDDAQRAAVTAPAGPLRIVAGPGTGKTRTLTHRIAWRVLRGELRPERILAITFTNRAADELRERLSALLAERAQALTVGTFHALGLQLVRAERAALALAEPVVLGEEERLALLEELRGVPLPRGRRERARLLDALSRSKQSLDGEEALPPTLRAARAAYDGALRAAGALDLDDLLLLPTRLLRDDPAARRRARDRFRALFVDEYQDVNPVQADLVRLLVGPERDVTAIGDPDQAIYGFRGADVALFRRFADDFPGTTTRRLDRCYRSPAAILAPARAVLAAPADDEAPGGALQSTVAGGLTVAFVEAASERAEAEQVVHAVERLVGGTTFFSRDSARVATGDEGAGLTFGDVAVLYRTRAQAAALTEAFARSGVPFQTAGEVAPLERPGARAALAALRLLLLPGCAAARAALPEAGPRRAAARDAALTALRDQAATAPPIDVVRALTAPALALGADDEALGPLVALAEGGGSLADVVARATLRHEQDAWDPRAERVALLTLHASKGLEFPVVFLVGCEDGFLPHRRGDAEPTPEEVAEERRLLYVGMTRAQRRLTLLHARTRTIFGRSEERRPSPFLAELAAGLLERARAGGEAPKKRAPPAPDAQLPLF